jgi:hypothetical protein
MSPGGGKGLKICTPKPKNIMCIFIDLYNFPSTGFSGNLRQYTYLILKPRHVSEQFNTDKNSHVATIHTPKVQCIISSLPVKDSGDTHKN